MYHNALEFFKVDVKLTSKMQDFKIKYGLSGMGFVIEIMRELSSQDGYFLKLDNELQRSICFQNRISPQKLQEYLQGLISAEFFDKEMFQKYRILTSEEIQRAWLYAKKDTYHLKIVETYLYNFSKQILQKKLKNLEENSQTKQDNKEIVDNNVKNNMNYRARENSENLNDNSESKKLRALAIWKNAGLPENIDDIPTQFIGATNEIIDALVTIVEFEKDIHIKNKLIDQATIIKLVWNIKAQVWAELFNIVYLNRAKIKNLPYYILGILVKNNDDKIPGWTLYEKEHDLLTQSEIIYEGFPRWDEAKSIKLKLINGIYFEGGSTVSVYIKHNNNIVFFNIAKNGIEYSTSLKDAIKISNNLKTLKGGK